MRDAGGIGSRCGWIKTYYKGCSGFLPDSLCQRGGGLFGGETPDHHSPERWAIGALHQMRRTELALERCAKALGAIAIEECAGLHGVPVVGRGSRGDRENVEPDASHAGSDERDRDGRGMRQIDHAILDEGTAIDDADVDGFVVAEVDDADPGSEGQGAMRGGEFFHVVDLAVGGGTPVIGMTVPTGESNFTIVNTWWSGCGGSVMLLRAGGQRQNRERERGDRGRPRYGSGDGSARGHLVRS